MRIRSGDAAHGSSSVIYVSKSQDQDSSADYKAQQIRSYDEGFRLEDDSILGMIQEYEEITTNQIQPIFPQLVIQQIHNTLVTGNCCRRSPTISNWCFISLATRTTRDHRAKRSGQDDADKPDQRDVATGRRHNPSRRP
jgi:hypothetical protein